jgi:hypothetical protein
LGDSQRDFIIDVLVQDAHKDDRYRGESKIVEKNVGVFEEIRSIKAVVQLIPEQRECPHNVLCFVRRLFKAIRKGVSNLIKEVGSHFSHPAVRPTTVNEHKPAKVAKLSNGIIRTHDSLSSFHTGDTDTDISLLNHGYIICT